MRRGVVIALCLLGAGLFGAAVAGCTSSSSGTATAASTSVSSPSTSSIPSPSPTSSAAPPPPATSSTVAALNSKQVLSLAERVAKEFGTYDYRTIKADFARIAPELTPSFRTDFIKLTSELEPVIVKAHGVTTATVTQARMTSFTTEKAVVVLTLVQHVQSSTGAVKDDRSTVRLTLERQADGQWLVSQLDLT